MQYGANNTSASGWQHVRFTESNMLIETVLLLILGVLLYIYIGYFLVLLILNAVGVNREVTSIVSEASDFIPKVTIIIAAHNEEKAIKKRIHNLLDQDFPSDKMEIIVASDGSTDGTVSEAQSVSSPLIKVLDFKPQRGRSTIHNRAISVAKGEIIFFSDVETSFDRSFLKSAVRYFADPKVGGLAGRLLYTTKDANNTAAMENVYWNYEVGIRQMESKLGILTAGSGACIIIRKKLFPNMKSNEDIDDVFPIVCKKSNYSFIFACDLVAYDIPPCSPKEEYEYRMRATAQGMASILNNIKCLDVLRMPMFIWALLSHRVVRWFTPHLFLCLFATTYLLPKASKAQLVLVLFQIALCFFAGLGYLLNGLGLKIKPFIFLITIINGYTGMLIGTIKAAFGRSPASYNSSR